MRAMDSTFTILGLTAHAYGLCASAAAFVLLGGMAILARRRRMPAGLTGLFGLLGIPLGIVCARALLEIPYGQTRTYAQQAQAVGSPRAYRAVGMANHVNPLPVLIPCHRVVGADGSLTGYAGGLKIKRKLLEIEQSGKG